MEADKSIHQEAIERSRAGGDISGFPMPDGSDDGGSYGADDFGGGGDDYDDDDDVGAGFDFHDGDHRFSSGSFQKASGSGDDDAGMFGTQTENSPSFTSHFAASQPPSQTTMLLDAIASGQVSSSAMMNTTVSSQYLDYSQALESLSGGNGWAGAAHWKKNKRAATNKKNKKAGASTQGTQGESEDTMIGKTPRKKTATRSNKNRVFVSIKEDIDNLEELFEQPKQKKSARGKAKTTNPLQLSQAMLTKHSKTDNTLPIDVGMGVAQVSSLFLRPNTSVHDLAASQKKTAGVTWGDDFDDNDDDDGGAGFDFGGGGDDDYEDYDHTGGDMLADTFVPVAQDLQNVRKVDKIQVGYATIAKKVDVKRLKKDLWEEMEQVLADKKKKIDAMDEVDSTQDEKDEDSNDKSIDDKEDVTTPAPISFQKTVQDMQTSQSQADVTLPFYFICILHLANEKGLALESQGLEDFCISSM